MPESVKDAPSHKQKQLHVASVTIIENVKKKDQHYVPRMYLKRFRDHKGKFYLLNLDKGTLNHTDDIGKTFSLPFLHDHPKIDIELGGIQGTENLLSKIESMTARGLEKFTKGVQSGECLCTPEEWLRALWFIALQIIRTPAHAKLHCTLKYQIAQSLINDIVARKFGPDTAAPRLSFDEHYERLTLLHDIERHEHIVSEIKRIPVFLLQNRTSAPFITSDNPVSVIPQEDTGQAVLLGDRAAFFVPLAPDAGALFLGRQYAGYAAPLVGLKVLTTETQFVESLNRIVGLNAQRTVLCRDGAFAGLEWAEGCAVMSTRGVETVTRCFDGKSAQSSHIVVESFFSKLKHLSAVSNAASIRVHEPSVKS